MTPSSPVNQGGRMKLAYITIPAMVVLLIVYVPFFRQPLPAILLVCFGLMGLGGQMVAADNARRGVQLRQDRSSGH